MELERLKILIGEENVKKINKTTVLVIGLGGVGSYTVESLVRSGIGKIIIVDNDIIDITNLNRQLMALHSNIGQNKVDVWEARIKDINPNCQVVKINNFITEDNIDILFNYRMDYIVDACDTIKTKKAIIKHCLKQKIKFISCMGTGKKLDPTKLKITDIRKTSYDPIAKTIRKMVKDENIKDKVPVIYSDEKPIDTKNYIGSCSFVPSVAGLLATSYVINDIVG